MKKKPVTIKPGIFKYLLLLPLLLLSFCQSEFEEPVGASQNKVAIDSKLLSLMKSAISSDSDQTMSKHKGDLYKGTTTEESGQCTNFLYPMSFEVFSGDNPVPETVVINSDDELIAFIEQFTYENEVGAYTPNYEMFIYFPITLLDTDGNETVLNNLTELEGTLQMAVEACASMDSGSGDGTDAGSGDGTDGGSGTGTDGGSGDGTDGGSGDGTDGGSGDGTDGGSGDGTDGGSGDGTDGGSGDGTDGGSGDGTDGGSGDGTDGGSGDGTDGGSGDGTDGGSGDGTDGGSGDGTDGGSGDGTDGGSGDGTDGGSGDGTDGGSGDGTDGGSGDGTDGVSVDFNNSENNQNDHEGPYKFCHKNGKKVYICHKGKTICVSVNAIWGHMQHHEEDFLGTCED